ncbi:hypothetical protein PRIPAC_78704 [Pristionchus pacificus]|uniref:Uncharacterized protein n=1 Tax=Pristionchus pacificus TaxID=54126 RepID=A0A2A6C382_PRIPA|nr:hypothetical protein PRIPAC_78704 [Pristionchus pacificus]|eukprot:PDM72590.1 hypothetical protein PRIPAC_39024 [Pristionchus pacificus]
MDFHLTVTNYVGTLSTLVNALFVILIIACPPNNLGLFRSQYYVGAFASLFFAATQLWSANFFYVNGTTFLLFSARSSGTTAFLLFAAALNLQFMMLGANFAARYAAVRGGMVRFYLTNHILFYSATLAGVFVEYIPPILFLSPTSDTRNIADTAYSEMLNIDFLNDYYFISTYEARFSITLTRNIFHLTFGSQFVHKSVFLMVIAFQCSQLLIMLVCGVATYFHISKHTLSKKLREVNNRLLRARSVLLFSLFVSALSVRVDASSISPILSCIMSFGTLFNPFVDITLTPDYRRRFVIIPISLLVIVISAQNTRQQMDKCKGQMTTRVSSETDLTLRFGIIMGLTLLSTGEAVVDNLSQSRKDRLKNYYFTDADQEGLCVQQMRLRISNETDLPLSIAIYAALFLHLTGATVIGSLSNNQKYRLKNYYMNDEMFTNVLLLVNLLLLFGADAQIKRETMAQCTAQMRQRVSNESDFILAIAINSALYLEFTGDKVIGGLSTTQKSRLKNFYMNDECMPFQELAEWYQPSSHW